MITHRLLPPGAFRTMPWKNGAGQTRELAAWPDGASVADFIWRVSIADVAAGGPFSTFDGVDRTLVLLAGKGLALRGAGFAATLHAPFESCRFAGELALDCTLPAGPVRDFNLMSRRERAQGTVVVVQDAAAFADRASFRVCYAVRGAYRCASGAAAPVVLPAKHALLIHGSGADAPLDLQAAGTGAVALVASVVLR